MPVLILHYHEIWLKGCNRNFFVSKLKDAAERALEGLPVRSVTHEDSRMLVYLTGSDDTGDGTAAGEAAQRLQKVGGVAYLAVARETEPAMEAIVQEGSRQMEGLAFGTFRVRARRAIKTYPFRSVDIERTLGRAIEDQAEAAGRPAKVNLEHADATCYVEVTKHRALIYTQKLPGLGGLPMGTAGKLLCLLSGGFDSAVAAYKIIKRGVRLSFVHFYGAPARVGEDSPPIARQLVRALTPYQGASRLHLVPFDDIQRQVVTSAPEAFRILIYRRLMLRIAEQIARRDKAHGVVTGDSIAQVASQTLQNIEAVNTVARMPVYRPLVGDDKQDILDLAKKIGTYEISAEPFTDCCPIYLPKSPRIFSSVWELDAAEAGLDVETLVREGVSRSSKEVYEYRNGAVRERVRQLNEAQPSQLASELAR